MRHGSLHSRQLRCPGPQAQGQALAAAPRSSRKGCQPAHLQESRRGVWTRAAPAPVSEAAEAGPNSAQEESSSPGEEREQQAGPGPSSFNNEQRQQGGYQNRSYNGGRSSEGFQRRSYNNDRSGGEGSYQRRSYNNDRSGGEGGYQRRSYNNDRSGGEGGERRPRPDATLVENPPCKVGDTVIATVVWAGERGMRATLEADETIKGFIPMSQAPFTLRGGRADGAPTPRISSMPAGVTREFLCLSVPDGGMEHNGKGPLLSAKEHDRELCWRRCQQMSDICLQENEYIMLKIESANRGGLVANFESTVVFIPFSRIPRDSSTILTPEDLERMWVGKTVPCVIEQVEPHNNKIIGNLRTAANAQSRRQIQTGMVVWGTVSRIRDFGAFVRPDEMDVDGLLHVSNISRQHVDHPQDVVQEGERIRVLVINVEQNARRISLSTAALELNPGDMYHNKEGVYATAEEMGKTWQETAGERQQQREDRPRRNSYGGGNSRYGGGGGGGRDFNDFDYNGGGSGGGGQEDFNDVW